MPAVAELGRETALPAREGSEAVGMRLFEPAGRTLEDAVLELCAELAESGRAGCPVCGGRMRAAGGCEGCGSELA